MLLLGMVDIGSAAIWPVVSVFGPPKIAQFGWHPASRSRRWASHKTKPRGYRWQISLAGL
jgi:hypothetical protein